MACRVDIVNDIFGNNDLDAGRIDGLRQAAKDYLGVNKGTIDAIRRRVLTMGSHDPMLDLLGQYLAERFPGTSLASANVGSLSFFSREFMPMPIVYSVSSRSQAS